MDGLYQKLIEYSNSTDYPMHMPGHKRNTALLSMVNPYAIDITEIEGFDNLHQPEGILKDLSTRIANLYGAKHSYGLVNGSTAGILAGISAATSWGDKVLIARNCHKSVYHGMVLKGLKPVYLYPQRISSIPINGGILAGEIEDLLIIEKNISLVLITSPTYEGVVSDISAIAQVVHRYGAILMVDEAHGAHFGFHKQLPQTATRLGADLVIQSLHKTLPALTQTAVLHCNRAELIQRIEQYLAIYESSSPSYVLMAGIDRCISLLEERKEELFEQYTNHLAKFYDKMKQLKHLKLADSQLVGQAGCFELDSSKISISVKGTGLNGYQLHQTLQEQYHLMLELTASDYVLAMTSICDTEEGFDRLAEALLRIDCQLEKKESLQKSNILYSQEIIAPQQVITPHKALEQRVRSVKLSESVGCICGAFVSLFPPGSPLLVPGERINESILTYLALMKQEKITITGLVGEEQSEINIVVEE